MLSANFGSHFLSAFSNFFTKRFSSFLQVYLIFSLIFSHILYYIFQCYSLCQCAVLNDYHKAYFCLCYPRSVFPSAFCPNFWVYKIIFCGGVITHFFCPKFFPTDGLKSLVKTQWEICLQFPQYFLCVLHCLDERRSHARQAFSIKLLFVL